MKNLAEKAKESYRSEPYPHIVIDNFITEEESALLISEASKIISTHNLKEVSTSMGGRRVLPYSDNRLKTIIKKSLSWRNLVDLLNSKEMVDLLLSNVVGSNIDIDLKRWLGSKTIYIKELPTIHKFISKRISKKWKHSLNSNVSSLSSLNLIITGILNILDDIYRIFISIFDHITGHRRLSLLFDYSISKKGYTREIHRDSDSRVIVFLLYLNSLENNVGGKLEIYKSLNNKKNYDPIPKLGNIKKFREIIPKEGRLIMFLNTSNAYHAASLMTNSDSERHFIYGAYTLSSDFFSMAAIKSSSRSPTSYNIYRHR